MALTEEQLGELARQVYTEEEVECGYHPINPLRLIKRFLSSLPYDVPCLECGQIPQGQSGIYECPKCGLPLVHDALPASAPSEQKPVYQFRPECENWIDCTEQFYESWRGEKRELYAAPQPEQENYKAQRDALLGKVIEARQALQFANDTPCGPINDTIWMMHGPETLFDFLDSAIASVKGGE